MPRVPILTEHRKFLARARGERGQRAIPRLQGMVEGLKTQEQDRAINELSFLERLGLLVDQQWSLGENQALARRLKAAKLRGSACVEDIDYRTARGLDKTVVRALAKDSAWVRNHENIFVLGPTGVGKSFIASALAQKACRDGGPPPYCANWPWHGPMEACVTSWLDWAVSMFWSLTGLWRR
jgi:DNA replication protein DnaC